MSYEQRQKEGQEQLELIRLDVILSKCLDEIKSERKRQDEKWGEQNHDPLYWISILVEEVGEAAKEVLENKFSNYRKELVQCAAVCVAAIESFDRNDEEAES